MEAIQEGIALLTECAPIAGHPDFTDAVEWYLSRSEHNDDSELIALIRVLEDYEFSVNENGELESLSRHCPEDPAVWDSTKKKWRS